jgi:hypothetical protein
MLVLLIGGILNYVVEMGSGAKFYEDWFRHSKVNGGGDTHTYIHRHTHRKVIS